MFALTKLFSVLSSLATAFPKLKGMFSNSPIGDPEVRKRCSTFIVYILCAAVALELIVRPVLVALYPDMSYSLPSIPVDDILQVILELCAEPPV